MVRPRRVPQTEEERHALLLRRGELATLAQHQAWPVYQAAMREEIETLKKTMLGHVMSDKGLTVEAQAYYRGLIRGIRGAIAVPGSAEARLDADGRERNREVVDVQH